MSLHTNISNESGYKFDHKSVEKILKSTIEKEGLKVAAEINVFLIREPEMAELHAKYMTSREATDVLSFPIWDKPLLEQEWGVDPDGIFRLGDIVICIEVAERQARENNWSTDEEIMFLANHGCLHLLGIHHEE